MDRILKHVNFICLNLHGSKGIAWKEVKLTKTNFNLQKWIFVCSWWLWTNQTQFTNENIFSEGFFIGSPRREKTSTQVQYKWPHLWVDFSFWASVVRNKIDFFSNEIVQELWSHPKQLYINFRLVKGAFWIRERQKFVDH